MCNVTRACNYIVSKMILCRIKPIHSPTLTFASILLSATMEHIDINNNNNCFIILYFARMTQRYIIARKVETICQFY